METLSETPEWSHSRLIGQDVEQMYVKQVLRHYQQQLLESPRALDYLQNTRGIDDPDVISHFKLGFGDRTLGLHLPNGETLQGDVMRGALQRKGLLKPNGRELFRGYLVFPVLDISGEILNVYGRRIAKYIPKGASPYERQYDHSNAIFNSSILSEYEHVILCSTPIEALTLWCRGIRNVVSTLGLTDFNDEHAKTLAESSLKSVAIAYANSSAGNRKSYLISQILLSQGVSNSIIRLPPSKDINQLHREALLMRGVLTALKQTGKSVIH